MTESLDKPKKRVLGLTGNMWIYAFGVMGINLAIGLVNSYQAEFFDKIMRLNLVGIALIILAAKFISLSSYRRSNHSVYFLKTPCPGTP